jgi:cytochrome c-type biogenesis protein CcmH
MQKILLTILIYLMTTQIVAINCYSVEPDEFLQNPKKELRARNISKNVRCLVCQNQSIDESSAALAKDLRILIRIKIEQGSSDEEIYSFLTERYGDFILLNPPFKISTLLLWVLPFVFLAIGIFVIFLHNNKSKKLDYNK